MPEEEILSLPQGSAKNLIKKGEMTILSPASSSKELSAGSHMYERARELLGKDFLGVEAIREIERKLSTMGINVEFNIDQLPEFPYTEEDLEFARNNGEMLVLRPQSLTFNGRDLPMSFINFRAIFENATDPALSEFAVPPNDWYKNESFAKATDQISLRWALVKKEVLDDSTSKKWQEQQDALNQYKNQLISAGAQQTDVKRRTAVEAAWDTYLYYLARNERLLQDRYDWTVSQASDGDRVRVGDLTERGLDVGRWPPGSSHPGIGVCPSR